MDINTLLPVMALMSCTGADRRNDTGCRGGGSLPVGLRDTGRNSIQQIHAALRTASYRNACHTNTDEAKGDILEGTCFIQVRKPASESDR